MRPRQNGYHFWDGIFKCIFLNKNIWILFKISLEFIPKGQINNIPVLVQIMVWRRPGDKPISEPMMVRLSTHMHHWFRYWLVCVKPISGPIRASENGARWVRRAEAETVKLMNEWKKYFGLQALRWSWIFFQTPWPDQWCLDYRRICATHWNPSSCKTKTYLCCLVSLLLMSWWHKEPGHQQPWYWPS